jgi:hypothetical protein
MPKAAARWRSVVWQLAAVAAVMLLVWFFAGNTAAGRLRHQ